MSNAEKNRKNPYQDTLNLPRTEFSIRANSATKEPEILDKWQKEDLFAKSWSKNKGNKKFVLHDGPPYSNGHIHIGHVLNKVLKDFVCKFKRMSGFHVPVKPGWDCHGLPIELKVVTANENLEDPVEIKKACRKYAYEWISVQKEEFKNLGVVMDWNNPYLTMSPEYEAAFLDAFAKFVADGYIERKGKTVPWCSSCQTVLATAEIEYQDRKDPSIYVFFPFETTTAQKLFSQINLEVGFLVWTTTPWTLPLNRAVVLSTVAKYVLLEVKEKNKAIIVAKDLADKICTVLGIEKIVLAEFESSIFQNQKVNHPFVQNLKVPVLLDNSVLLDEGTACVHSAPGCGPEDYVLGIKNGLEIYSPLSADGKYTNEIAPAELNGVKITDGQIWVLRKLDEVGRLLHKTSLKHSYPHCWRCHNGLMFRATEQWFCDLQKNDLVKKSVQEIEKIKFIPDWGRTRLNAFIGNRAEWCISRQRTWGVPITSLLCKECGQDFLDADFIRNIAKGVLKEGIEYWDKITLSDLVDLGIISKNFACKKCKNSDLNKFKKESDILDVWFDSGVSHYTVLRQDPENLGVPADIYLEGSDQHRGWFQSSLLCSMILNNHTCTKEFLTHGFVVDEKGYKMSKSVGNVVAPQDVIKKYSRDILRLWVASADYHNDIAISEKILENVAEVYRKIRNTCRFLISNLYDFDVTKDKVEFDDLLEIDRLALENLTQISDKILQSYQDYNFAGVFHTLNNYCANDLSALYLDICKDRLYVEKSDGLARRSAQTAIYYILDTITHLMAPTISFLAEEISDFYQKDKKESIHLQNFVSVDFKTETGLQAWDFLQELRPIVLKAIEQKRVADLVKHSLEAKVKIYLDPASEQKKKLDLFLKQLKGKNQDFTRFFKDWFIVSQFEFVDIFDALQKTEKEWIYVSVDHADGVKCPRCWQWEKTDHETQLCVRCREVLGK